jgi:hypothetical protein
MPRAKPNNDPKIMISNLFGELGFSLATGVFMVL